MLSNSARRCSSHNQVWKDSNLVLGGLNFHVVEVLNLYLPCTNVAGPVGSSVKAWYLRFYQEQNHLASAKKAEDPWIPEHADC